MKLKIFKEEDKKEREVKLMLHQVDERVFLAVANQSGGPEWHLLSVSPDGIYLYSGVPAHLGFKMSGSRVFVVSD